MNSVILSVKPKWCDLISSGKKTIEVRKNRPKLETPFKCYIYCCKPKQVLRYVAHYDGGGTAFVKTPDGSNWYCSVLRSGKVIGEFICDRITLYPYEPYNDGEHYIPYGEFEQIGMDGIEIFDYLRFNDGYGWHISNLKIYDKPKDLSKFGLSRPPQSWCYIERNDKDD